MSASRLLVPVGDLLGRTGRRRAFVADVEFDGLALTSSFVPPGESVTIELQLEAVVGGLSAYGTVSIPWRGECRRCLDPVAGRTVVKVKELFAKDPIDEEIYPLDGERADLESLVREAVLLALPISPLCAESCAGPDPERYPAAPAVDSVEEPRAKDPRWAALDQLDFESE